MVTDKGNDISVAVVDDDTNLCRSFARLLRAAGMRPTTYPSAETFLTDPAHPKFDCLVLDIQLTGMSGLELQRRLAEAGDTVPVVFITAHDSAAARREAYAGGCANYFRKSDPGSKILSAIRRVAIPASGSR